MILKHYPCLFPLLFFIAGIAIQNYHPVQGKLYACLLLIWLMLFIFSIFKKLIPFAQSLFCFLFIGLGIICFESNNHSINKNHFSQFENSDYLIVRISSIKKTKKGCKIIAQVVGKESKGIYQAVLGNLIIYTKGIELFELYDFYKIENKYSELKEYKNPNSFNYSQYLKEQNIYHESFLNADELQPFSKSCLFHNSVKKCKHFINSYFNEKMESDDAASLVSAILLGEKDGMNPDLKKLFTNNGLAHLLAISGMHVGIIFLLLSFFLGFIHPFGLKNILILIGIWFYILLTGMEVPAVRAGFMFSLYIFGKILGRNLKPMNSVFFAAIVLLSITPKLLFQLSFQFSFGAMVSIFLFYSPIFSLLSIKNKFFLKVWQICSLTLAVQILVLPISIYYFDQLPSYFLISSIVSFPFIVALIWLSVLSLIYSFFGTAINPFLDLLEYLVNFFIHIIEVINNLPFALLERFDFGGPELLLWILGILSFHLFFFRKKVKLFYCIASFLPFFLVMPLQAILTHEQATITIYDHPKEIIIDLGMPDEVHRFQESKSSKSFFINNKFEKTQESMINTLPKIGRNSVLKFMNNSMIIVEDELPNNIDSKYEICILKDIQNVPNLNTCKTIILPRSLSQKERIHIKNKYSNHHLTFFDISEKGAYQLKI